MNNLLRALGHAGAASSTFALVNVCDVVNDVDRI